MRTSLPSLNHRQLGFSLPEIMVGMVIGLLGIIIIMQVTSVFEGQKRTTSSGDDAQNGGAIALYTMQRDIAQAGYGFSSANLMGRDFVTPNITFAASSPLAAVVLNHVNLDSVADAETDTLIVTYGNSNSTPEGAVIVNSNPATYNIVGGAAASGVAAAGGGHGFMNGDWVTADDGSGNGGNVNTHYLYKVDGVDAITVPVTSPNGYPIPVLQDTAVGPHPLLYNFGPSPSILAYAVRNGSLSVCDYLARACDAGNDADWTALTGGIVSMRAQCIGGSALRIVLVARNSQIAGAVVTTATPNWNPNGVPAPVATNPAASWGADWNRYRYKTFETIVPIRNAVWKGVAGC